MLIWAMFISVKEVSGSLSAPGLAFEASGGQQALSATTDFGDSIPL